MYPSSISSQPGPAKHAAGSGQVSLPDPSHIPRSSLAPHPVSRPIYDSPDLTAYKSQGPKNYMQPLFPVMCCSLLPGTSQANPPNLDEGEESKINSVERSSIRSQKKNSPSQAYSYRYKKYTEHQIKNTRKNIPMA